MSTLLKILFPDYTDEVVLDVVSKDIEYLLTLVNEDTKVE